MKVIIAKDYEDGARNAADIIEKSIKLLDKVPTDLSGLCIAFDKGAHSLQETCRELETLEKNCEARLKEIQTIPAGSGKRNGRDLIKTEIFALAPVLFCISGQKAVRTQVDMHLFGICFLGSYQGPAPAAAQFDDPVQLGDQPGSFFHLIRTVQI